MELCSNRSTNVFITTCLLANLIFTLVHVADSKQILISTESTSPTAEQTTETETFPMLANQPPIVNRRMKKVAITAGKTFRYSLPADLFTDPEDGNNLTFSMYEAENVPLNKYSWIQFIPGKREVYGLPLEEHVSRWSFVVEARDREGLVARTPFDITVQQSKSRRTINHQFVMQLQVLKDYSNAIDWQIRALEGIVNLFTNMHQITVLDATQSGDLYEFVWTNETLSGITCPREDIKRLMKIMESETESNIPSTALVQAMSPELVVNRVEWREAGCCRSHFPLPALISV